MPSRTLPRRQPAASARPTPPRAAGGARAPEGIIVAVVSVTGTEDSGGDVIAPGAYGATLLVRKPKVVHHHDFAAMAGRVLHIEELLPGDPRLPKRTGQGRPWPRQAGALVATMQLNLASEQGRETYEAARFYSESNECQWSVGYRVSPGQSAKRGDTRVIYGLELYEISLVAVGMHQDTMTLEVKHAGLALERKAALAGGSAAYVAAPAAAAVLQAKALPVLEQKYDTSPVGTPGGRQNWVDQQGGLPSFIRAVAHALIRNGHSKSSAIAMAVGSMKRWASGGDNVTAKTRAKAVKAVAQWEAMKAGAHATKADAAGLKAAGLVVRAADTGRILMLQRALDDDDPASGTWEFPGGHIEDDEDPLVAALREWQEETGAELPSGRITGQWTSPNGIYRGYVLEVPVETAVGLNAPHDQRSVLNPDDPDGDMPEVAAWFAPHTVPSMPALRPECKDTPWSLLSGVEAKSAAAAVIEARTSGRFLVERKAAAWDESKYERGQAGSPNGGRFVSKGAGYGKASAGEKKKVADVQRALIKGGHLGKADGSAGKGDDSLFGAKTEAAVKKWQVANGHKPTGRLDSKQQAALTGKSAGKKGGKERARGAGRVEKREDPDRFYQGPGSKRLRRGSGVTTGSGGRRNRAELEEDAKRSRLERDAQAARQVRDDERRRRGQSVSTKRAGGMDNKMGVIMGKALQTSLEERTTAVRQALNDLAAGGGLGSQGGYPSILATYDDHVVVKVHAPGGGAASAFVVPYGWRGDVALLDEPQPVQVRMVTVPEERGQDEDDAAEAAEIAEGLEPAVGLPGSLLDAAAMLRGITVESKAFAALPGLAGSVTALVDALSEKGMDVPGVLFGYDDEDEAKGEGGYVPAPGEGDDDLMDLDEDGEGPEPDADAALAMIPRPAPGVAAGGAAVPAGDEASIDAEIADDEAEMASVPAPGGEMDDEDGEDVTLDPEDVRDTLASLTA